VPRPGERQTGDGTGGDPAAARRPTTLQEARALAHPLRLRILRLCLDQALTNGELAASLGQRPATVLHHVRTLLATGFLAEEASRPGPRGTTEKPYRATGKSWRVDVGETSEAGAVRRAMFEAVAAEIDEAGPGAVIENYRMAMRLLPDQLDALLGRIRDLIEESRSAGEYLSAGPPEGDPYAMLVVLHRRRHPAMARTEPDLPRRAGPGPRAAGGAPSS
jgi:DNA-binding transcriptional ArsR family regulator